MVPFGLCDPLFGSTSSRTVSRAMPLYVSNTGKVSECFFFLTRGSLTDGRAHNGGRADFSMWEHDFGKYTGCDNATFTPSLNPLFQHQLKCCTKIPLKIFPGI